MPVRVACPLYVNCLPILHGIRSGAVPFPGELITAPPTGLNKDLAEKKIEVGLISSIEYARHQEDYLLLPEICLNSLGPVMSVGLFSRFPAESLQGRTVILTETSATSQILLKLILRLKFQLTDVEYHELPPDLDRMLNHGPAALLIGDQALEARGRTELHYYDLGQLWLEMTGLPFVYAVFAMHREWVEREPGAAVGVLRSLRESLEYGLAHLPELDREARKTLKYVPEDFGGYFKVLGYHWSDEARQGLLKFYKLAGDWKLAPKCEKLEFFKT